MLYPFVSPQKPKADDQGSNPQPRSSAKQQHRAAKSFQHSIPTTAVGEQHLVVENDSLCK